MLILSSEVGVLDIPEENIKIKSRLQPGRILLVDTLQKKIITQVYGSMASMINANSGTSAMAFAALFNDGGSIKNDTLKERRIFVFVFESGYPVWVTYSPADNGLVSYVSNWIIADCTKIDSEESFISELNLYNIPTLEAKVIK